MSNFKRITDPGLEAARKMPSHKLGAWFEGHIQANLKVIKERYPIDWLRLYDTKSAGAYLPNQPADFIVSCIKDVYLLEAKCSGRYLSLRAGLSSLVKQNQAVSHYTWHRSGHGTHFLFCSVSEGLLQLWDGGHVSTCRRAGDRLNPAEGLIYEGPARQLPELLLSAYTGEPCVDIIL